MSGFIPRLGYVRPVLQAVGGSRLNRSIKQGELIQYEDIDL